MLKLLIPLVFASELMGKALQAKPGSAILANAREQYYPHAVTTVALTYNKLRQGTGENGDLRLSFYPCPEGCWVATPNRAQPKLSVPILFFEEAPGFRIKNVRRRGRLGEFQFRISVSSDVTPGTYELKARLDFQSLAARGVSGAREEQISFPITVCERNEPVRVVAPYLKSATPLQWTIGILLLPLLFPIWLTGG